MAYVCLIPIPALAQSVAQTAVQTGWQPVEQVETYPVTGDSGIDLYASIGEHGPKIGKEVRAIAHTNFKLTWTRKYEPQPDGSCVITTNRPRLIVVYTLPKPAVPLAPELKKKWDVFIDGIRRHEHVHGATIVSMVKEIEKASVGLRAAGDPKCDKVRADLQVKLGAISRAQQQASVDFDKVEMSPGGNVHQLILALVNK